MYARLGGYAKGNVGWERVEDRFSPNSSHFAEMGQVAHEITETFNFLHPPSKAMGSAMERGRKNTPPFQFWGPAGPFRQTFAMGVGHPGPHNYKIPLLTWEKTKLPLSR